MRPGIHQPVGAARSRARQLRELRNRLASSGLGLLPSFVAPRAQGALGILTYHRVVAPPPRAARPTWNVRPENFRRQLAGLLGRGYQALTLSAVLDRHRSGKDVPARTFVVTLDDGYECVYRHAFPILRELNVPATIFLATAYLDGGEPFPFDDWQCKGSPDVPADAWRPLTSAQCAEMTASGLVELGTHTHVHDDFRGRPEALRADLGVSLEILRARFGVTDASFAFPYGLGCGKDDGPELAVAAQRAGVSCALTMDSELVMPGDDPLNWARFGAFDSDSPASLAAKLDGRFSVARSAWRWLRRADRRRAIYLGTSAAAASS